MIKGLVVSVGYDDLLSITLPRNIRHLDSCLVVTSLTDERSKALAENTPFTTYFETDAFYRSGAAFNKGLAIELAMDVLGRDGWILIWDADTLFPDIMPLPPLETGKLYGPPRRILNDPKQWEPNFDWNRAVMSHDPTFPGYFQLFNGADPVLEKRPWYDVTFSHAGGGDGYFESRWHKHTKVRLGFPVLHLGPRDKNWMGRATSRIDGLPVPNAEENKSKMDDFLSYHGWGARQDRPQVQEFNERVQVEGYEPSGFELKRNKR